MPVKNNTIKFTKTTLASLPLPPAGKRVFWWSDRTKGLAVQVTSSGAKTFYLYRKVKGKPERIHLGTFPETPLDVVVGKADELNGAIAQRKDPRAGAPRRGEMTLADLWRWYLEEHAKARKKTWKNDEYVWANHLAPTFGTVRLSDITRADVRAWHAETSEKGNPKTTGGGPVAANKALYLLRVMYNLAGDHEVYDGFNPAMGIRPNKERARVRRLAPGELQRLFGALELEADPDTRDWVRIALYTGQRKGDFLAMRWEQIDWHRREWRIPETKNGEPQLVPLEDDELAILKHRKSFVKGPWVFPGRADSATGHLMNISKQWERICTRAELDDFHVHDLRRTNGSMLADGGASMPVIGSALGHKDMASTQIYVQLDTTPVREAKRRALAEMEASKRRALAEIEAKRLAGRSTP